MKPKNAKTNFHEPMPLRILSAARSTNVSSLPLRTPGCLCHCVFQAIVGPPLCVDCTRYNLVIDSYTQQRSKHAEREERRTSGVRAQAVLAQRFAICECPRVSNYDMR